MPLVKKCGENVGVKPFENRFQKRKKPEAFPLQAFWHPHSESNQELIFCSEEKAETLDTTGFPLKNVEIPTLLVSCSSC